MADKIHVLTPTAGFSEGLGLHLSALEEVREQVREAVRGMSNEEIKRPAFAGAHPIGDAHPAHRRSGMVVDTVCPLLKNRDEG